jgi:RNA recognition motif-containing protein
VARRKLIPARIQLFGQPIAVDWAEPEPEVDDDVMNTVKVLYVRNLMLNTSEEQIKNHFEKLKANSVERVKKMKDFAFVHFKEREDALNAMKQLNGSKIDDAIIEITLSKPPDKANFLRLTTRGTPSPTSHLLAGCLDPNELNILLTNAAVAAAANGHTTPNLGLIPAHSNNGIPCGMISSSSSFQQQPQQQQQAIGALAFTDPNINLQFQIQSANQHHMPPSIGFHQNIPKYFLINLNFNK